MKWASAGSGLDLAVRYVSERDRRELKILHKSLPPRTLECRLTQASKNQWRILRSLVGSRYYKLYSI
jgi:hypothetical protein